MAGILDTVKSLIAGGHEELQAGGASAHDEGVYAAHPHPEPIPVMNPIQNNKDLRDEILGGPNKVSPSHGVY